MPLKDIHYVDSYDQALKEAGDNLVVVAFFNSWSESCKWVSSLVEEYSKRAPSALFLRVDVDETDENEDVADREDVKDSDVPAFKFYRSGAAASPPLKLASSEQLQEALDVLLVRN
eukprot:TRINITY_DN6614_c0_g1_i1.p1 TRINITY_DN6614_c0_g1~~TRINITY_DN6614_c0_g1_i1.p1  ORF type:complete len:116 (-),score=35.29 TRINITY_DN6614_c0_g1_i1:624-971(-)